MLLLFVKVAAGAAQCLGLCLAGVLRGWLVLRFLTFLNFCASSCRTGQGGDGLTREYMHAAPWHASCQLQGGCFHRLSHANQEAATLLQHINTHTTSTHSTVAASAVYMCMPALDTPHPLGWRGSSHSWPWQWTYTHTTTIAPVSFTTGPSATPTTGIHSV